MSDKSDWQKFKDEVNEDPSSKALFEKKLKSIPMEHVLETLDQVVGVY